jgi:quercetin dioxygenase-like cupin family protein
MTETAKFFKHSQIENWDSIPVETLDGGIKRQMFIGNNLMICRLVFPPHLVTPAHEHPHEQMTIVQRGRVKFIIGEEEIIAEQGDVLRFPPKCWHGATMLDEEVELIDIFTPIREDFLVKIEPTEILAQTDVNSSKS